MKIDSNPQSAKPSVLILRGNQTYADLELVIAGWAEMGIKTEVFNINRLLNGEELFDEVIKNFHWSEIGVIDLRYCRDILRNWEKGYKQIFHKLKEFLELQQAAGNTITVNPSFESLYWVLDKACYLSELWKIGIPTIPTVIFSSSSEELDLLDYFNRNGVDRIVLKPAISSGADGLEFIKRVKGENNKYEVKKYSWENGQALQKIILLEGDRQLRSHFIDYHQRHKLPILLQKFEEIKSEISAVFINSKPHFVQRSLGENTEIAHEKFGGENIFILKPPEAWQNLADKIYQALPDEAKNIVSLRIDMFERMDGELILSEIEGASHRVLFPETLSYYKEYPQGEKLEISKLELREISLVKKYIETLSKMAGLSLIDN